MEVDTGLGEEEGIGMTTTIKWHKIVSESISGG